MRALLSCNYLRAPNRCFSKMLCFLHAFFLSFQILFLRHCFLLSTLSWLGKQLSRSPVCLQTWEIGFSQPSLFSRCWEISTFGLGSKEQSDLYSSCIQFLTTLSSRVGLLGQGGYFSVIRLSAHACEKEESAVILNASLEQGRPLPTTLQFSHPTSCPLTVNDVGNKSKRIITRFPPYLQPIDKSLKQAE